MPEPSHDSEVLYAVDARVATLTLNRPTKLNAWTPAMHERFISAVDRADSDDDVRAIIVTGNGRGFCAGADLSSGAATWDPESPGRRRLREARGTIGGYVRDGAAVVSLRLLQCKKPVIAAINGPAVGIGASLTLPMDIRIASRSARIGFVFTRRGIAPDGASSWFLPRIVGITQALDWMTTGRIFDAEEGLRQGLISEVAANDSLLPRAHEIARQIADNTSAVSVAVTRQMLWRSLGASSPWEAHRLESKGYALLGGGRDAQEAAVAFSERRAPVFSATLRSDLPFLAEGWPPQPEDVEPPTAGPAAATAQ